LKSTEPDSKSGEKQVMAGIVPASILCPEAARDFAVIDRVRPVSG